MKAYRISEHVAGPLPLPSLHRGTYTDAEPYRLQAAGKMPMPQQNLDRARGLRAITLSGGRGPALFKADGATISFVIGGRLTLHLEGGDVMLAPGDLALVEQGAGPRWSAMPGTCLVQVTVDPGWPGGDAAMQDEGSAMPRDGEAPLVMRVFEAADHRSYLAPFPELFSAPEDVWTEGRPTSGLRFLRFPDGSFIDWHPEVVNNLAIFLSGEMEIEARGENPVARFRAGDVLLAEDRKGEGHIDRMHGDIHLALIVMEDENLWPMGDGQ